MRLLLLLPLYFILSTAIPVHQLDADGDEFASALLSPTPTPSVTVTPLASISIAPLASVSITPTAEPSLTAQPSASPIPSTSDLSTPLPSVTPEPETLTTETSPTPSVTASIEPSTSVTATPSPDDELLPPVDNGFGDFEDSDDDDDDDDPLDDGDAFGFSPDQVSEEAAPKNADGAIASAPSTISALALVGIAVAILAPAVIIFWFVRRRRSAAGFENIPRVDTDSYQGTSHGTFTVA